MTTLIVPHWIELILIAVGLALYAVACFFLGILIFKVLWRIAGAYHRSLKRKLQQ